MAIDKKLVEKVAGIARVDLSEDEKERFSKELEEILQAFECLKEVNVEGINPSFHVKEIKNVWREDKVERYEWDPLGNTRHKEKKYFKGPRIV